MSRKVTRGLSAIDTYQTWYTMPPAPLSAAPTLTGMSGPRKQAKQDEVTGTYDTPGRLDPSLALVRLVLGVPHLASVVLENGGNVLVAFGRRLCSRGLDLGHC